MSAPVVDNRSPATSVPIGPTDAVSFDVTCATDFLTILVLVAMPDAGLYEVAYDGASFAPVYAERSRKATIANGFRFTIRRAAGWASDPTVNVTAINTAGEAAT